MGTVSSWPAQAPENSSRVRRSTEPCLDNPRISLTALQDIHFGRDVVGGGYPSRFGEEAGGSTRHRPAAAAVPSTH